MQTDYAKLIKALRSRTWLVTHYNESGMAAKIPEADELCQEAANVIERLLKVTANGNESADTPAQGPAPSPSQ